ncbi:MAG TPA: CapA family protein [Actinoplanes sp.]|jgi:poly-gamma-glutamate capsule biosynthesis protein CapA/YwtB (metallophosphatase superfamily)
MDSHPPDRSLGLFGRPVLTVTLALAVLIGAGVGTVAFANRDRSTGAAKGREPAISAAPAAVESSVPPTGAPAAPGTVTLTATGDIMMSNAPGKMPPNDGAGFFDSVREALASDLVMGNLEQPLTENTGAAKCGSPPEPNCYAFRSPPSYARHLSDAGFDLVNTANNHTRDMGTAGARNTRAALDDAGVKYTGNTGEITVVEVRGVKVAVIGFSSYAGANNLNDLGAARAVVRAGTERADLVVVQVHMGAEGSDSQHVRPGTEMFHGENRGDPVRFSHAVIDAGADLVVGHGPHVLRGMEFYQGRLIAYSLGNFAGGGRTLKGTGLLKYGGVLRVTLAADGTFAGGGFHSTYMNSAGLPTRDAQNERGRELVAGLSEDDFGDNAVSVAADGSLTAPA